MLELKLNTAKISYNFDYIISLWLKEHQNDIKPQTLQKYQNTLKSVEYLCFCNLDEFTLSFWQRQLEKFKKQGWSNNKIKDTFVVLKLIFDFAVAKNFVDKNNISNLKLPRVARKEKTIFTKQELEKIKNECVHKLTYKKSQQNAKAILIAIETGCRIGEICGLKWSDVDFITGTISIQRTVNDNFGISTPKTLKSIRIIPLTNVLLEYFKIWKKQGGEFIVTASSKIKEIRNLQRFFVNMQSKLNIEPHSFHTLRHNFASNLIQLNADIATVSSLLGHTNTTTTLNIYTHSNLENKRQVITKLNKQEKTTKQVTELKKEIKELQNKIAVLEKENAELKNNLKDC